jgi:two-component system sensor histidine kinase TctE
MTSSSSIRFDLLKWLIIPLLIINLLGALLIYVLAWTPAQIAFDQSLADAAYDIRPHIHPSADGLELDLSPQAEQMLRINHTDSVFFVVRDAAARTLAGDRDFPTVFLSLKLNESMAYNGALRGQPVRIVVLQTLVGTQPVWIGVAETLTKRHRIQARILFSLLILEAVLVLASVAIVWFAVKEGLFPLQKMQGELDARSPIDLSPVTEQDVAEELNPLIKAINGLLYRAQLDGKARQTFLANVAHQLRTPLAGFRTQLELLQKKYAAEPESARSIDLMMSSAERMVRQTNQLLSLARAEPSLFEKERLSEVALDALLAESIEHFVLEADKKEIDIGFDLKPATVMGDRFLLRDLVDNLVDNAIRYSPRGGRVTVRCLADGGAGRIVVEDCGPGVAMEDREKIFSRFYRLDDKVAGSGLGLAIVRDIVKAHGAEIEIGAGPGGKGTMFIVKFPPDSANVADSPGLPADA